ncbi:hypothetical protein MD484_g6145, partial [Candolleomyces efflorescens]
MSGGLGGFLGGLAENAIKNHLNSPSQSQTDVSKTGGQEYNSPHHSGQSSGYGGSPSCKSSDSTLTPKMSSDQEIGDTVDKDEVVKTAEKHGSGESSLFATALSFLSDNKEKEKEPLDEDDVTRAHNKVYNEGKTSGLSANALGGAAALQVLKQFTSGSSSSSSSQGGNSQTQLISLAMAEATKLFDKTGGSASGNKQDAVNGAAMTIMKLLVQSKFGGGATGGKDSGGLSGLLGLAQQFAK